MKDKFEKALKKASSVTTRRRPNCSLGHKLSLLSRIMRKHLFIPKLYSEIISSILMIQVSFPIYFQMFGNKHVSFVYNIFHVIHWFLNSYQRLLHSILN